MAVSPELTTAAPLPATVPVRVVTATALFDGHDAAINVMRRLLQAQGAEVIHLGHNRSAVEIVRAAIQEDAAAIAVSSYQGGHNEFFRYLIDLLREQGAGHIQVFGGGGGVIVPAEIAALQDYGVARIYSPEDGRTLGLKPMIADLLARARAGLRVPALQPGADLDSSMALAHCLSAVEYAQTADADGLTQFLGGLPAAGGTPVLGITGTGGAGKSSLTDELACRFLQDFPDKRLAILSMDPTRRKTGGALLGDRIRMNSAADDRVFMRSLATRGHGAGVSGALAPCLRVLRAAGFDLVVVETAGIGQADAGVVDLVDVSLYVMTAEFGAASQLEKIEMIDQADMVAINKFDRAGSMDALRDVRKQYQRNHERFGEPVEDMPVYGTTASRFNDEGVTALYLALLDRIRDRQPGQDWQSALPRPQRKCSSPRDAVIPAGRARYLAEIAEAVRGYHRRADGQAAAVRQWDQAKATVALLDGGAPKDAVAVLVSRLADRIAPETEALLAAYGELQATYRAAEYLYTVRGRDLHVPLYRESLSGSAIPRIALPHMSDPGDQVRWMLRENVPGRFPFTAGVFPFKRDDETPTRMFAGEGDAKRTNTRFHLLARDSEAKRLSTAFDSVTLYGEDPGAQPDVYGKVGSSGVSIGTLDDMKQLYEGFDLCAPGTSVSMTINGPAPTILAFFFNTAIDQAVERFRAEQRRGPDTAEAGAITAQVLRSVRGTVQADVLKEDQGQNTCIFSIDFALRMMGDIQQYFIDHDVRNFYSVSISGYHIAEAGANPITQLAFTLANGFTYVEHYLARGMAADDFAPNLSFFFSCGMDPEYAVLNRVARRIWAIALRDRYGANERSQKLKAHIQTSGRSLHAQEVQFNDIRTTLEALTAYYDHCNSLHTNAYDEAVTTPTEGSVRRAVAIQLIIQREHGLAMNENPLQGSHLIEELTDLVEEAVLAEFERLSDRGGVLGAMERGYQRGKIQEESLRYEHRKSDGSYPIVGVNTFVDAGADHDRAIGGMELRRGTEAEKAGQIQRLATFHERHRTVAGPALARLKDVCRSGENTFAALMEASRVCSLGQITQALYEVGGRYRRNT